MSFEFNPVSTRQLLEVTLPDIVGAIGTPSFAPCMGDFIAQVCGADHFAVFVLGHDEVSALEIDPSETAQRQVSLYESKQYWKKDPMILEAARCGLRGEARMIQADMSNVFDSRLRDLLYPNIRERLVLCGRRGSVAYGLSILRSERCADMTESQENALISSASHVVSALAKHDETLWRRPAPSDSLTTLAEISDCIRESKLLPKREGEVCARVLYGMSAAGIALDLGIGEESAKTYRKRAYSHLGIGSPRELLVWYLQLWSSRRFSALGIPGNRLTH